MYSLVYNIVCTVQDTSEKLYNEKYYANIKLTTFHASLFHYSTNFTHFLYYNTIFYPLWLQCFGRTHGELYGTHFQNISQGLQFIGFYRMSLIKGLCPCSIVHIIITMYTVHRNWFYHTYYMYVMCVSNLQFWNI